MKNNFRMIVSGRYCRLGKFRRDGYTVHLAGQGTEVTRYLAEAKKIAVEHGASGKFVKRTRLDGRNSRAEYTDAVKEGA